MTLSMQDVAYRYEKRFSVLENISFSISKGQFLGVFGPNGGGKTTLLKLLLGLLIPTKGRIEILGTTPEKAQSKIGYVPQVRRFDKQFPISVLEVILQGILSKHKGWGGFSKPLKEKGLATLEQVGLADKASNAFGALSGGQIQRALIARALVSDPEILLLDEATVGVDPEALKEILELLIGMRGKITILMVTHDLQAIAHEMDLLLCINQSLTEYSPEKVCEHFAMGLYHPTLKKKKSDD